MTRVILRGGHRIHHADFTREIWLKAMGRVVEMGDDDYDDPVRYAELSLIDIPYEISYLAGSKTASKQCMATVNIDDIVGVLDE